MFTKTGKIGKTNHVFTSEKEFLFQEDWILKAKGKAVYDQYLARATSGDTMHPDQIALYEEWLEAEGVTHTMTEDEE